MHLRQSGRQTNIFQKMDRRQIGTLGVRIRKESQGIPVTQIEIQIDKQTNCCSLLFVLFFYLPSTVYYVLFTVYCILCMCIVCVLCTVYCVLRFVFCVLCTMYWELCTVYCVLCSCSMFCKLCSVYYVLGTVHCVLCTMFLFCVLRTMFCVLCTRNCVLCTVKCKYLYLCCLLQGKKRLNEFQNNIVNWTKTNTNQKHFDI